MRSTDPATSPVQRRLLVLGASLFLLGLLTGFVSGATANPRMGLSSHLEGVMNGTFLIALGAAWGHVHLGPRAERIAFWSLAFGTVTNWATTLLAALWGTGRMTPLAAPGLNGAPWQEAVVSAGLIALALAMLAGTTLVLFGLLAGDRARDRSTAHHNRGSE
jgi:hydroxylaminobenzene mutase